MQPNLYKFFFGYQWTRQLVLNRVSLWHYLCLGKSINCTFFCALCTQNVAIKCTEMQPKGSFISSTTENYMQSRNAFLPFWRLVSGDAHRHTHTTQTPFKSVECLSKKRILLFMYYLNSLNKWIHEMRAVCWLVLFFAAFNLVVVVVDVVELCSKGSVCPYLSLVLFKTDKKNCVVVHRILYAM